MLVFVFVFFCQLPYTNAIVSESTMFVTMAQGDGRQWTPTNSITTLSQCAQRLSVELDISGTSTSAPVESILMSTFGFDPSVGQFFEKVVENLV